MAQEPWIKNWLWKPVLGGFVGGALLASATAAQADPPGIYYSWRAMATDVNRCIRQAENALEAQNLSPVQTDAVSIAGQSDDATAVFVCMEAPDPTVTTVMVIVASADNDRALALREALKRAF